MVWRSDMLEWMRTNVIAFRKFLQGVLLEILVITTIDPLEDLDRELDAWHNEKSFERALKLVTHERLHIGHFGRKLL